MRKEFWTSKNLFLTAEFAKSAQSTQSYNNVYQAFAIFS